MHLGWRVLIPIIYPISSTGIVILRAEIAIYDFK
jgi:hypothetical protein